MKSRITLAGAVAAFLSAMAASPAMADDSYSAAPADSAATAVPSAGGLIWD